MSLLLCIGRLVSKTARPVFEDYDRNHHLRCQALLVLVYQFSLNLFIYMYLSFLYIFGLAYVMYLSNLSSQGQWRIQEGTRAPPSNFFHFHVVFSKRFTEQECIPVGCVPSATVAVCSRGWVSARGCLPVGDVCQTTPPPVNRMTDVCENITLPQLRCGR